LDRGSPSEAAIPADLVISPDTASPPDTSQTDLPTGPACSQGQATPVAQWSGKMVLCDAVSGTDQCNANSLCNTSAGWHLCTATEYLVHGGTKSGGPKAAWLQACIRDGGAPFKPIDKICSACSSAVDVDGKAAVSWYCTTGSVLTSTTALYIGVTTSQSGCKRLGENLLATEAEWTHRKADSTVHAAACCHN
jgi:hypothetical protein